MHMAWHSIDSSTFLKEGKMRNLVLLIATLLVSVFGFSTLSSSPSPAAEVVQPVVTGNNTQPSDDEKYYSFFTCVAGEDSESVALAFKNGYESARSIANSLVEQERCAYSYAAGTGYHRDEIQNLKCQKISDTQCLQIAKGYTTNDNNETVTAYMILQPAGYPSEGPEYSEYKGLVWALK